LDLAVTSKKFRSKLFSYIDTEEVGYITKSQLDVLDDALWKICQTFTNLVNGSQSQFEKFGRPSVNLEIIYMTKECTFDFVDHTSTGKIYKKDFYKFIYMLSHYARALTLFPEIDVNDDKRISI